MMDQEATVQLLNELLGNEQRNLAGRLIESTVFVSHLLTADLTAIQRMARMSDEHGAWLADVILKLGSAPGPRIPDATSADLHYQDLRHALPRLVEDWEARIQVYERAAGRVSNEWNEADLIQRILARHREGLATLRERCDLKAGPVA